LNGNILTPASNKVNFVGKDGERESETVLSKKDAKRYTLKNIFPDWKVKKITRKLSKQANKLKKKTF